MTAATINLREAMPVLARHEGEWKGTYTFIDPANKIIDHHEAHLSNTFPDSGDFPYHQTNRYRWEDGKTEVIEFPATFENGKLHFDTDRIIGDAWEVDDRCIVLHWNYKADPSVYLYELIHIDDTGNHRTRTWHWFKDGVCFQRTLINETRIS